jgi:succinoglycan biosynthesis protein ExoL
MARAAFAAGACLRVSYFVHDLSDPAVSRRVRMLQAGGADVLLFGFRRTPDQITYVAGAPAVDLGRTHNARLASRALSVLKALLGVRRWSKGMSGSDAVLARNLEMLVLAHAGVGAVARSARLSYELLDVHRLLVSGSVLGSGLRAVEAFLLRRTAVTLVSSPAFSTNYFERFSRPVGRLEIVENKVFEPAGSPARAKVSKTAGPPWRIGWFGMIRCRRSLDILCELARAADGLIQVEIRGRPSYDVFDDFDGQVARSPHLSFGGPYDPLELADLYGSVHFAWSIDFFEEGLNSSWLLPNRLYESQLYDAVPIALKDVEAGRWLARHGSGLLIDDAEHDLLTRFQRVTEQEYLELARRTAAVPHADLAAGPDECAALVRSLAGVEASK